MADKPGFNLKLEQYLLGELPPLEKKQLEAELERNVGLRAQLEKLRGDTAAYYARYPRLNLPERKTWWRERSFRLFAGGLAFATAAVLAAILLPRPGERTLPEARGKTVQEEPTLLALNPGTDNGDRSKGMQPALFLSTQRDGQLVELKEGAQVSAGEEITVAYRSSGYRYGVIVSVDANHSVTLHFPESATGSQQLAKGTARLKLAFRLDEKPGSEKFFFVASAQPLPLRQIEHELQKTGSLRPTGDTNTRIATITLSKK